MAKQPGSTAYLHQSEPWRAEQAVTVLPTATEERRDTTAERVTDPLSKTPFPHPLYTNFKLYFSLKISMEMCSNIPLCPVLRRTEVDWHRPFVFSNVHNVPTQLRNHEQASGEAFWQPNLGFLQGNQQKMEHHLLILMNKNIQNHVDSVSKKQMFSNSFPRIWISTHQTLLRS